MCYYDREFERNTAPSPEFKNRNETTTKTNEEKQIEKFAKNRKRRNERNSMRIS